MQRPDRGYRCGAGLSLDVHGGVQHGECFDDFGSRSPSERERVVTYATVPNQGATGPQHGFYDPDSAAYDDVSFAVSFIDLSLADESEAVRELENSLAPLDR